VAQTVDVITRVVANATFVQTKW